MKGLEEIGAWGRYLAGLGRRPAGVGSGRLDMEHFLEWVQGLGVESIYRVSRKHFLSWLDGQVAYRKKDGSPLAPSTINNRVGSIRSFFRYLLDKGKIVVDPTEGFQWLDRGDRLPRGVYTKREVEQVLAAPDLATPIGYRDRTLLELLYSSGIRREEAARLTTGDIDFDRGLVRVEMAKNKVGRLVPVGRVALSFLAGYLEEVRPVILGGRRTPALFVSVLGKPLSPNGVYGRVKKYVHEAGLREELAVHSFRHSCATHMLEGGAGIRVVAEQLGHKTISSTVVYTRLTAMDLRKAIKKHHPRERARREKVEDPGPPLRCHGRKKKRAPKRRKRNRGSGS